MSSVKESVEIFLLSGSNGFRSARQEKPSIVDQTTSSILENEVSETTHQVSSETHLNMNTKQHAKTDVLYTSQCLVGGSKNNIDDDGDDESDAEENNERFEITSELNDSIDRGSTAQATVYHGSNISNADKIALREYCEKLHEEINLTLEMKFLLDRTEIHKMSK
jgi:hypothetical protein